jgi:hypothetical protein
MSEANNTLGSLLLGGAFIGSLLMADNLSNSTEHFGNDGSVSAGGMGKDSNYSPQMQQRMQAMRAKYQAAQAQARGGKESFGNGASGAPGQPMPMQPTMSAQPQQQGYPGYPGQPQFYQGAQAAAQQRYNSQMASGPQQALHTQSNRAYAGPNGGIPQSQANVNLNTSGDQLLSYQLYQQAVNAATPTEVQLESISGQSQQQTGLTADQLKGGLSSDYAPYNILGNGGPQLYDSEFQAVNLGNPRAESISACAQNAPTFVATSLLPKPTIPGQESWDIGAPQNILANQNFLSSTQQLGVDTVLSSLRNSSYDLRQTIPNPINVVSPWQNTSITPDLERRPLECQIPNNGLYGCGNGGPNNGTFVGM